MQNVRHFLAAEFALQSDGRERALAVDNGAYINVQKSLFNADSFGYKTLLLFCFKEPLSHQEGVLFFKGQLTNNFNFG